MTKVIKGSSPDIVINIENWLGVSPEFFNFTIEFYTEEGISYSIEKQNLNKEDNNTYTTKLDSSKLGEGKVKARVTAEYNENNIETKEIIIVSTDIKIVENELS